MVKLRRGKHVCVCTHTLPAHRWPHAAGGRESGLWLISKSLSGLFLKGFPCTWIWILGIVGISCGWCKRSEIELKWNTLLCCVTSQEPYRNNPPQPETSASCVFLCSFLFFPSSGAFSFLPSPAPPSAPSRSHSSHSWPPPLGAVSSMQKPEGFPLSPHCFATVFLSWQLHSVAPIPAAVALGPDGPLLHTGFALHHSLRGWTNPATWCSISYIAHINARMCHTEEAFNDCVNAFPLMWCAVHDLYCDHCIELEDKRKILGGKLCLTCFVALGA